MPRLLRPVRGAGRIDEGVGIQGCAAATRRVLRVGGRCQAEAHIGCVA